jgi:hypothetical protein
MNQPNKVSPRWRVVAIGAILIALVFAYLDHGRDVDRESDIRSQIDVARQLASEKNREIMRLQADSARIARDRDAWVMSSAKVIEGLERRNARQARQLASVDRIIEIDSSEFTRDQLLLRDSIIAGKDTVIIQLKEERTAVAMFEAKEDILQNEKLRMVNDLAKMWEQTAIEQNNAREAERKKYKRQALKAKILAGAVAAVAVWLGFD